MVLMMLYTDEYAIPPKDLLLDYNQEVEHIEEEKDEDTLAKIHFRRKSLQRTTTHIAELREEVRQELDRHQCTHLLHDLERKLVTNPMTRYELRSHLKYLKRVARSGFCKKLICNLGPRKV